MTRTDKQLRLATTLLVLLLVFIWGNSLLPGEISGTISALVRDLIAFLLPGDDIPGEGHGLLRKAAHFTEFACLGMVLTWIMHLVSKPAFLALAGGFAVACVDETIQMFVPDRGPAFTDVLLDTSGVLAGLFLFLLIRHFRRNE